MAALEMAVGREARHGGCFRSRGCVARRRCLQSSGVWPDARRAHLEDRPVRRFWLLLVALVALAEPALAHKSSPARDA